jgi:hypothetical protein
MNNNSVTLRRRTLFSVLLTCLLSIVVALSGVSNVYAVSVKITNVQYPTTVTYGSPDIIHIHATVSYVGLFQKQGDYGGLVVWVGDRDSNESYINGMDVVVTGDSYPIIQGKSQATGLPFSLAEIHPLTIGVGQETLDFAFSGTHAPARPSWRLVVDAFIIAADPNDPYNPAKIQTVVDAADTTISIIGIPATTAPSYTSSSTAAFTSINQIASSTTGTSFLQANAEWLAPIAIVAILAVGFVVFRISSKKMKTR